MPFLKLGFLASHGGSNMQAIIDACKKGYIYGEPAVVISNNSNSGAIQRAKNEAIPYYHISSIKYPTQDQLDQAIIEKLQLHDVNLVILAGYMKKIGTKLIQQYKGKILNIHPALLPKFGGKGMYGNYVHQAVLDAGEKFTGPTVHVIDEEYDKGTILAQKQIPVLPNG